MFGGNAFDVLQEESVDTHVWGKADGIGVGDHGFLVTFGFFEALGPDGEEDGVFLWIWLLIEVLRCSWPSS